MNDASLMCVCQSSRQRFTTLGRLLRSPANATSRRLQALPIDEFADDINRLIPFPNVEDTHDGRVIELCRSTSLTFKIVAGRVRSLMASQLDRDRAT